MNSKAPSGGPHVAMAAGGQGAAPPAAKRAVPCSVLDLPDHLITQCLAPIDQAER